MKELELDQHWDLVIIGGGVTGAGIFREAVRLGIRVLLLEQRDFAWGTSSRSSKMVHGGVRYLKEGRFLLTRTSVKERERLLKEAPGLIEPLEFLVPVYSDHGPGRRALEIGLSIYGLMAHEKQHSYFDLETFRKMVPDISPQHLEGGFRFLDAQVDDARLVLRLIQEGEAQGGKALNYVQATDILRNDAGRVVGLHIEDSETQNGLMVSTGAVINATGVWAENLHPSPKAHLHLRPLRGSHLIFPADKIPIGQAVSFYHPEDMRPIFVCPWEGVVLLGTTDVDHEDDLKSDPQMSADEARYLIRGVNACFPSRNIQLTDCISSLAGVRPVLSEGKLPPSKESRENIVWVDKGLVTVTGGKLTTFRKMAEDSLKAAKPFLPDSARPYTDGPVFDLSKEPSPFGVLSPEAWERLVGRYGKAARTMVAQAGNGDLQCIPGTHTLWAELPHAAEHEKVRHLDDLLLRRVRIGILCPHGGEAHMARIRRSCEAVLPWDAIRWDSEIQAYLDLCRRAYGVPEPRNTDMC